jgi:hypothetical protein
MFEINNKTNKITLTQGNSAIIDITPYLNDSQNPIVLQEGDKVLFTVKSVSGREYLKKILTNNDYDNEEDTSLNVVLTPEDTVNLAPYRYLYDLLLIYANGEAYTFIGTSEFEITQAVGTINDLTQDRVDDDEY